MPSTPNLSVRPTFNRATTDESIIPLAHLGRSMSGQSTVSQHSGHASPNDVSRPASNAFQFSPPLIRTTSDMGAPRPRMPSPLDSPVHTGPQSRLERVQGAVTAPFRPRGVMFENAARALPYWREGLFVATTIGMATWLGVVTGRMRALEDIPYCVIP